MKTSYFYQMQRGVEGAISIAVGKPKYVEIDSEMKQLAPSWALLTDFRNDKINEDEYTERFRKQLDRLDINSVISQLVKLANGKEPVLMCHCGKQHFCHRHIVAEWIEKKTGIDVEEYGVGEVKRLNGRIV